MFLEWRGARAELSHDWLERGLLSQLEFMTDDHDALERTARVCRDWWSSAILPRLRDVLRRLPSCLMPSMLLRDRLHNGALATLDAAALTHPVAAGLGLIEIKERIEANAFDTERQLERFAQLCNGPARQDALTSGRQLVASLRMLPRSVVMP